MNLLRISLQLKRAQRIDSVSEAALHSPDRTPVGYKKVLKHISAEMKKIIKNLSFGRSTNDVLRIGHEVGGRAHPLGHHDLVSPAVVVAFPVGHSRARSPRK